MSIVNLDNDNDSNDNDNSLLRVEVSVKVILAYVQNYVHQGKDYIHYKKAISVSSLNYIYQLVFDSIHIKYIYQIYIKYISNIYQIMLKL